MGNTPSIVAEAVKVLLTTLGVLRQDVILDQARFNDRSPQRRLCSIEASASWSEALSEATQPVSKDQNIKPDTRTCENDFELRFESPLPGMVVPDVYKMKEYMDKMIKKLKRAYDANLKSAKRAKFSDFEVLGVLGQGAFATVVGAMASQYHPEPVAIKVMIKEEVFPALPQILQERRVLFATNFPFIVKFFFSFQDNCNIYMVMEFAKGKTLDDLILAGRGVDEVAARFYAAQILLALEYLHGGDIIFRDLKPQNVLIDERGYVKLADFGLAKRVSLRTYTFIGTPEYFSPELLDSQPYGKSVDFWALGVFIYVMLFLDFPFGDRDDHQMYLKIQYNRPAFPTNKPISPECRNMVCQLLQKVIDRRLGLLQGGISDVRNHAWFASINWDVMFSKQYESPLKPRFVGYPPGPRLMYEPPTSKINVYPLEFADF